MVDFSEIRIGTTMQQLESFVNNQTNLSDQAKGSIFNFINDENIKSNEELVEKISNFDKDMYDKELEQFLDSIGSFEYGYSCEKLVERINSVCFN